MDGTSTCLSWWKCGAVIEGEVERCPHCGGQVASRREMLVRGTVLVGLGLFLILFMLYFALEITGWMFEPGMAGRPLAYVGLLISYAFLGGFIFFGVMIIRAGIQMRDGGPIALSVREGMIWFILLFFAVGALASAVMGLG